MRFKSAIVAFAAIFFFPAFGAISRAADQTMAILPALPVLTLQESIDIALKQSALIHSASEGVDAAESAKKEAFTGFLPMLNTYYSYTRLNEPPYAALSVNNSPPIVGITGTSDNYNWAVR